MLMISSLKNFVSKQMLKLFIHLKTRSLLSSLALIPALANKLHLKLHVALSRLMTAQLLFVFLIFVLGQATVQRLSS